MKLTKLFMLTIAFFAVVGVAGTALGTGVCTGANAKWALVQVNDCNSTTPPLTIFNKMTIISKPTDPTTSLTIEHNDSGLPSGSWYCGSKVTSGVRGYADDDNYFPGDPLASSHDMAYATSMVVNGVGNGGAKFPIFLFQGTDGPRGKRFQVVEPLMGDQAKPCYDNQSSQKCYWKVCLCENPECA